jgi:rare lipoprotein A
MRRALLAIFAILALMAYAARPAHAEGAPRAMRASWYGAGKITRFEPSRFTASGERFDRWELTAAHRTLPFGTRLLVCFFGCAIVRVNDRGPAKWTGRSLDLSKGAALRVGLHAVGSGVVRVAVLAHGAAR